MPKVRRGLRLLPTTLMIVLVSGCSSTTPQDATPSAGGRAGATSMPRADLLKPYQNKDLSFRYPADWYESHDAPGRRTPGGYEPIVYLSSQRLGPDCVTAPPTTTCGVKVALGGPLHPGDIVVFWLGFGGPGYQTPEATNQTIAGFPAQVDRDAPNPV